MTNLSAHYHSAQKLCSTTSHGLSKQSLKKARAHFTRFIKYLLLLLLFPLKKHKTRRRRHCLLHNPGKKIPVAHVGSNSSRSLAHARRPITISLPSKIHTHTISLSHSLLTASLSAGQKGDTDRFSLSLSSQVASCPMPLFPAFLISRSRARGRGKSACAYQEARLRAISPGDYRSSPFRRRRWIMLSQFEGGLPSAAG